MKIHSQSVIGERALKEKEAVLIGLSIKNSYFKDENIEELISWAHEHFGKVNIMCPDEPAFHTLLSLGHSEKKAKEKSTLECNRLVNKCNRVIANLKLADRARIIRWVDLNQNEAYRSTLKDIEHLYKSNESFRTDVRATTRQVIEQHGTTLPIETAIDIGVDFFLKELALIINSAEILKVPLSAYVYHKRMPVLEHMLDGKYGYQPPTNTGYLVCETQHSLSATQNMLK